MPLRHYITAIGYHLKLFRWPNLLMIALTMILTRYALILPGLGLEADLMPLRGIDFTCLVLSMVFISAGGYVINDYYDLAIDRINHPDRMVVGKVVSLGQASAYHLVFSITGIALGLIPSLHAGSFRLAGIQLIYVAVLWYYSFRYKQLLFWGNFVVSLLTALIIPLVWLYEFFGLRQDVLVFADGIPGFAMVNYCILAYFLFAFLLTFAREILKDCLDVTGDQQHGCRNFPIHFGQVGAARMAGTLLVLVLLLMAVLHFWVLPGLSLWVALYAGLFIDLPMLYLVYLIFRPGKEIPYRLLVSSLKWTMLAGILSMIFIQM